MSQSTRFNTFEVIASSVYMEELKEISKRVDDHLSELYGHERGDTAEEWLNEYSAVTIVLWYQVLPQVLLFDENFSTCRNPAKCEKMSWLKPHTIRVKNNSN